MAARQGGEADAVDVADPGVPGGGATNHGGGRGRPDARPGPAPTARTTCQTAMLRSRGNRPGRGKRRERALSGLRNSAKNPLDHEPQAVTYAREQAGLTKAQVAHSPRLRSPMRAVSRQA